MVPWSDMNFASKSVNTEHTQTALGGFTRTPMQQYAWVKISYLIALLLGAFFSFLTIFFVLGSIQQFTQLPPSQITGVGLAVGLALAITLTYIQATTAYGFLFCKQWVRYIVYIHTAAILLAGFVILPLTNLTHLIEPTLTAAVPYFFITAFVIFTPVLQHQSRWSGVVTVTYLLMILVTISLNIYTHI